MTHDTLESDETPEARVGALMAGEAHRALVELVRSILAEKSTRKVPDVLHEYGLLSRFEVYDCDHAWTEAEDRARDEARAELDR